MDYLKALFSFALIPVILFVSVSIGTVLLGALGAIVGFIGGCYLLYRYFAAPIKNQCNGIVLRADGVQFGRCLNTGTNKVKGNLYCTECYEKVGKNISNSLNALNTQVVQSNSKANTARNKWIYTKATGVLTNSVTEEKYTASQIKWVQDGAIGFEILHGKTPWVNNYEIDFE